MIITEKFKQVLYGLIISSFLLLSFSLIVLPNLKWDNDVKQVYQMIIQIIYSFALWYGISLITKKQNLSLMAFFLQNSVKFYFLALQLFNSNSLSNNNTTYHYTSLILAILAFSGFGYYYFKHQKGLWLGIVGLFLTSASSGANAFYLLSIFFHELYDPSTIFYTYLDLFYLTFTTPLPFLLFWILYNIIKQQNFSDFYFSFRTVSLTNTKDKVLLSIIFWMFRMAISGSLVFGVPYVFNYGYDGINFSLLTTINLIIFCAWIYFSGSVYRNFLTSIFINHGKYPNWIYYLLNIPILNIIGWLIYLFRPAGGSEKIEIIDNDNSQSEPKNEIILVKLQDKFILKGRNKFMQIFIFAIIITYTIFELINLNGYGSYDDVLNLLISKAILITGLVLYFKYKQIGYVIFVLSSILLITFSTFGVKILLAYFSPSSMISIVIFYPLFHFDKMKTIEQKDSN